MLALYKEGGALALGEVPKPKPAADEILVKVAIAGLCRTDLEVARNAIRTPDPLILGHEFSGWIEALGSSVTGLALGQPVAVFPRLPCQSCPACRARSRCRKPDFLGLTRHGAFAEFVAVPAASVVPTKASVDLAELAYAEPVAAALGAVPDENFRRSRGLILGDNRIGRLTEALLQLKGFREVEVVAEGDVRELDAASYDFGIEARASAAALAGLVRALCPGGLLILKSRSPRPCPVPLGEVVLKGLTLRGVAYGSFKEAVALIEEKILELGVFLESPRPLGDYREVFALAERCERRKSMFLLAEG